MGQNIDSEGTLSRGHYPRNKKQEQIVKMFGKIIQWIESYKFGAKWLETIRQQPHFNSEILFVGNYFINVTSDKNPEYLIITNKEELDEVKKQTNYELVLSLPLL